LRSSARSSLSGAVADRYTIEGELGRGGTAIVYRARDRVRGIDVAIKLLREDAMSAMSVERFLLEIRQTAKLPHPHIVPVLDSGQIEGRPYFVLPYMDGGTLRERLLRQKQLPFEEVIALGATIGRALEFAHAHGVIHRDVKPENILYNNGQPCLADFGTARALERAANDPTTSTGVVRGTAAYMSPEQASGERNYDGRTDIYSLACVLYECVAGIQPFVGPTLQAVISQRLSHAPRPVSVYRPSVPPGLEQVLVKATAMVPADRYQRAGELADALELITPTLTNLRVTPPGHPSPVGKARRAVVIGVITAAVAGAAGIAFTSGAVDRWRFSDTPVDTTRIAILPFDTAGAPSGMNGEDMLHEGFRHWSGLTINESYETRDAVRQAINGADLRADPALLSIRKATQVARSVGAGRFIRGRFLRSGERQFAYAAIFDVTGSRPLHYATVDLGSSARAALEAFASLADSLVLRHSGDAVAKVPHGSVSDLAGIQALLLARDALDNWDLAAADSLFTRAAETDPTNVRAIFWRTQTKSWRGIKPQGWGSISLLKSAGGAGLSPFEVRLASALVALKEGRYADACAIYTRLKDERTQDFAAWYGLSECHWLDPVVLADSASRSHWRFRSSYEQAIQAYRKALEVLPSSYRALQNSGYDALNGRLFTDPTTLMQGQSVTGERFLARVSLANDTAVFTPFPAKLFGLADSRPDPAAVQRAVIRHRNMFAEIARRWVIAMPQSAGANEALGYSLELIGDPRASAAYRQARELSPDSSQRLRLEVQATIVQLKAGIGDPATLAVVMDSVDAILHRTRPTRNNAELLARLAALSGRCKQAAMLASQLGMSRAIVDVNAPTIIAALDSAFAAIAAGCHDTRIPEMRQALRRAGASDHDIEGVEASAVAPLLGLRFPRDPDLIRTFGRAGDDYVLRAAAFLLDGKRDSARAVMARVLPQRESGMPGTLGADVAVTEAQLWLALGDSTRAAWLLDQSLNGLRYAVPLGFDPMPNLLQLGSIGPAVRLRADLNASGSSRDERWSEIARRLWRNADESLRARGRRPQQP
jgi:serine/threonine-protein kinase